MSFVGGKLKLKGGVDPTQLKGGVKKKKKKAAADALAVVPADGAAAGGEGGDPQAAQGSKDGVPLDPAAVQDRRTEAEKKVGGRGLQGNAGVAAGQVAQRLRLLWAPPCRLARLRRWPAGRTTHCPAADLAPACPPACPLPPAAPRRRPTSSSTRSSGRARRRPSRTATASRS